MRTSNKAGRVATRRMLVTLAGGLLGLGLGALPGIGAKHGIVIEPALAFDGSTTPNTASLTPADGLRSGAGAPQSGEQPNALTSLQYAAEQGEPAAQWKLGHMYANGEGVPQDDLRAFSYFSQIANAHPDETPGTPQASFVANAFVSLGHY
jgi:TPR repeat protein